MTRSLIPLAAAVVIGACVDSFAPRPPASAAPQATPDALAPPQAQTPVVSPPSDDAYIEDERNTIEVFEAASRGTVFVTQRQVVRDWSRGLIEVPKGSGTGFVWDDQGHIVTNYHVIEGGQSYSVTLSDGTEYAASLVGGEPRKDIAVLRIDEPPDDLVAIRVAEQEQELRVGQKAVAIGNPFGLDNTLTVGVISALGRDVEGYGGVTIRDMVQTDASINPGNSGGPLLDSQGRLIGMNTMIFSRSGASAGIGFAVPSPTIRRVVGQIIEHGHPLNVGLGVVLLQDLQARRLGLQGVIIRQVMPDSPAERAGLRGMTRTPRGVALGDVIVGIDGEPVARYDDLYQILDQHKPGDLIQVRYVRDGAPFEARVEVDLIQ